MAWELLAQQPTLLPPVARFFAGVFLILVVEVVILAFVLYLFSRYGKEE